MFVGVMFLPVRTIGLISHAASMLHFSHAAHEGLQASNTSREERKDEWFFSRWWWRGERMLVCLTKCEQAGNFWFFQSVGYATTYCNAFCAFTHP